MTRVDPINAEVETMLAGARSAVRDDPKIRKILADFAAIKQRIEKRAQLRGSSDFASMSGMDFKELYELADLLGEMANKMQGYQLH